MKINPYHPHAQNLVQCWAMNEGGGNTIFDAINNNNGTIHGATWNYDQLEPSIDFEFINNQYISVPIKIDTSGPITIVMGSYTSTPNDWGTVFGGYGTDSAQDRLLMHLHSDNTIYWDYGYGSPGNDGRLTTSYAAYLNKPTNIALVSEGIGGVFKGIYLNGALVASDTVSDGPTGDVIIDIGRLNQGATGSYYHNGIITYFYIYNQMLSDDMILSLDRDPYGMFVPDFTPSIITVAGDAGVANAGALMMAMMI